MSRKPGKKSAAKPQGGGKERRQFIRTQVIWTGTLEFHDQSVECVIMNASANGAKVRVAVAMPFPETVTLRIPRLGDFRAEVVWSKDNKIGVRFLEEPSKVAELMGQLLPQTKAAS